jgi:alkanesulfonate monooxygenase SsuD/methylene tetrahydromethanopterin reductase-like flavin-dependent oxidoreductase (luciferase family)
LRRELSVNPSWRNKTLVKLGLALPNHLPWELDRGLLLDWARLADHMGFESLATLDRPNYDSWDPLVTLAAVAVVTERARLITGILQLPNRNPVLVAKQAAVVDRISKGRMELGLGVGSRPDDYEVFGATFDGRGGRFASSVQVIRDTWSAAHRAESSRGALGPAPISRPGPFVWIGATTRRTIERAVRIGDGLMLSGTNAMLAELPAMLEHVRATAAAEGKEVFPVSRILYVAVDGVGPEVASRATHNLERFYDRWAWAPVSEMIHIGPVDDLRRITEQHAEAGLDELILIPEVADLKQVEKLGEALLNET